MRGLSVVWDAAGVPAILSCTAAGVVRMHAAESTSDVAQLRDGGDAGVAGPSCAWMERASWTVSSNVLCTVSQAGWRQAPAKVPSTLLLRTPLSSACCVQALDSDAGHLAVGAKGSELGVWDTHTQQRVFLGKGAKPNRIGLVDPAQNSAVAYIPGGVGRKVGRSAKGAAHDRRSEQAMERLCSHAGARRDREAQAATVRCACAPPAGA